MRTPGWRRPRRWSVLTMTAQQHLVGQALDVVESLEGSGWRMVSTQLPYAAHELEPATPDPATTGPTPVVPRYMGAQVTWPVPWSSPEYDYIESDDITRADAPARTSALVRPYVDAATDPQMRTARGTPGAVQ
jgi:hypothetical protein